MKTVITLKNDGSEKVESLSYSRCDESENITLNIGDLRIEGITRDQAKKILLQMATYMGRGYKLEIP